MNRNIRDYEVSVWTLQDSFITVLKHSGTDNKGRIEEPDFDLKNDGTLTFKFSIPMYLKENNVKIENPIWYNTTNGNIIADLRKIKVIFHKNTEYEHIFELLITKVTESHEGFQLTCDVECESLAFHELGKSGYKLSLNQDTFIDYWTKWANGEITGNEPKSNIKFWSDKVIEGTDWECEVQMDWSGYDTSRASNIIYEDAYAAAWDVSNEDKFIPTTVVQSKEKERLIDVEESNRYNITQTIAETFGVHCRYEYEHDSDYHITARKIIFYNAFVQEALGPIDINYAYNTTDISREMDSKDTITKMYVKTLTDSNTESGLATIADTAANKSQEDYLLNFDYLYSIGTISQEQYDAVEPYEIKMHQLNEELKGYERQISALENQKIDAAAAKAVAKNAVSLDNERISANNDLLNAITNNTGVVHVTATRPDTCAIIRNNNNNNSYINLRQKGIIPTTIHIYENFTPGATNALSNEIISYTLNYDEFGNLIKISNITSSSENTQIVYLIYDYEPRLYYENILKTWETRLARDTNEQQFQEQVLENIDAELTNLSAIQENKLNEKRDVIKRFERLMGPAIREGYWQPEDEYAKYGERYEENLILSNSSKLDDNLFSIGWDNVLFDEEDTNYYEIELTQSQEYYPCIRLSNLNIFNTLNYDLNQISFIYQDAVAPASTSTDDIRYLRFLPIGSQCQLRFIHLKDSFSSVIEPVLMLTGLKDVSYNIFDITNYPNTHPRIGVLTTNMSSGSISSNITTLIDETTIRSNLISGIENYEMVYPRIQINSANLKVSEDSLVLKYGNIVLNNYEDYYILGRTDSITNIFKYYITIKPEQLFQKIGYGSYKLLCELSNAGLFMYLDAVQIMKENAYPRVSYEIKPTFVNDEFIRYAYKYLNYIVHINDPELKFEYVKGYITELHLKLDSPKDDTITIDNYKTKFEDLFSTIVVQTEEMKKNSTLIGMAAQAFTPTGGLQADLVQTVMDRVDLNYAFNNGTLTINEEDGIWGTSDSGVVAFRGGGIFTATEKDNGEWIWNTGILPSGINASLITTGQLDTNLIRIFAGDDLKLQMNGDGLFAYRSQWSNDNGTIAADATRADGLDLGQYVVHNGDGLFLTAEAGTIIGEDENHNPIALENKVDRVSITWNGLTLRNWNNDRTLWADADTGNLTVEGTIRAKELLIIDEDSGSSGATDIDTYINDKIAENPSDFLTVDSEIITNLQNQIDGEIDTWFFEGTPAPISSGTLRLSINLEDEWGIQWNDGYGYSEDDLIKILRHNSDIYYDIGTPENSLTAGQAFRFIAQENNNTINYYWFTISDTATTAALAAAAEAKTAANNAQDTANSKIRTFYASQKDNVVEKTPNIENINFNDGDLWVNASDNNNLYRYNVINQQWIKADKKIIQIERQYKRWHPTNFGWGPPMDEETADADNPAGAPDTGKRWEELLYGGANNEKTSSQNAGITKWSTDYPGFLDKILYSWIQANPKEEFYPDITIEDENYVIYTRNKITWDDNTITYTVPQLNMNLNDTEVKAFNIKHGNDNGIDFSIPSTNNNATVQINRDVGIKVTDDNQNYFQTTATQMGFWRYDGIDSTTQEPTFTQQLGFTNGTLFVRNGALIGGWTTTVDSLYSGGANTFDNGEDGIYLGPDGLSVSGNNYKAHFNTSDFVVNIGGTNTSLQIDENGAIIKDLTVTGSVNLPGNITNIYRGTTNITIGSNNCTYSTLKECADDLSNKYLNQDITITLTEDLTTTTTVDFYGITGFGDITINGYNSDGDNYCIIGQLRIINCSCSFIIKDFVVVAKNINNPPIPIRIYGKNYILFSNLQVLNYGSYDINSPNNYYPTTCLQINYGASVTITSHLNGINLFYGNNSQIQCNSNSFLYVNADITTEHVPQYFIDAVGSVVIIKYRSSDCDESHCQLIDCITKFSSSSTTPIVPDPIPDEGNPISAYVTPLKIWRRADPEGWAQAGDTNYLQGSNKENSWTDYHTCVWYNLSSYSGRTIKSAILTIYRDTNVNENRNVTIKIYGMHVAYREGRPSNDGWTTITSTVNPYNITNNVFSSVSIDITAAFQDMVNNNITGLAIGLDKTERDGTTWSSGNTTYSYNYAKFVTSNNFRIDFTYV